MKNIFKSLLIVLVTVSFMSCSSDDDSSNDNSGDTSGTLVGTWNLVELTIDGDTTSEVAGQSLSVDFDAIGENFNYSLTFSDPDEFIGSGSYDLILTSTVDGETITETESINDIVTEGTWEQNGTMLTINGNLTDDSASIPVSNEIAQPPFVIEELTDTTLTIRQEFNVEQTANDITNNISLITEATFTR